ncbi:hypothetical protein DFJ74DRAFT_632691 [Hyaloraphidium curvatum]|nr:hypothetical protein DFJ74DRAFT_632691 [Hyaloraphidium curvatum]
MHVLALVIVMAYPLRWEAAALMFLEYQIGMFGITMGYHRLWSHRAFKAALPLRAALALAGTLGFQGSIKWWVLRHRMHHNYTDTEHDPYDARKGFWFSHIGWIFEHPKYQRMKYIDARDLDSDPVVRLQHRFFALIALALCFLGPALAARAWYGDFLSGLLWGGVVLRVVLWHAVFCINSWAHMVGERRYSLGVTARGNLGLSVLTNGEGWHNFHHSFPHDYRNGVDWFHWDPTKWLILLCRAAGLAWDLERTPYNEVVKARVLTAEDEAAEVRRAISWGPDPKNLPAMTMREFEDAVAKDPSKQWIVVDGTVADVARFLARHPGGERALRAWIGRDATETFHDGLLNRHTAAARSLVDMMAVARIVGGRTPRS